MNVGHFQARLHLIELELRIADCRSQTVVWKEYKTGILKHCWFLTSIGRDQRWRCVCRGGVYFNNTEHKCTIKIDGTPRGSGCETTSGAVPLVRSVGARDVCKVICMAISGGANSLALLWSPLCMHWKLALQAWPSYVIAALSCLAFLSRTGWCTSLSACSPCFCSVE